MSIVVDVVDTAQVTDGDGVNAVMSVERVWIQAAGDECRNIADMGCWG